MDVDTTFRGPVNRNVTEYEIQDGITTIAEEAFTYCEFLTSVKIPKSVTTIGKSAFQDCKYLESIDIPDSVLSIEYAAFAHCISLKSVVIPSSVTTIGDCVFEWCENLESVVISPNVKEIKYAMFDNCSSLKSVVIPDGVTIIRDSAFSGCSRLSSINIPPSVTAIGDAAFGGTRLESIVIPNSVHNISSDTFNKCPYLSVIEWRGNTKNKVVLVDSKNFYPKEHGTIDPLTLQCPKNVTIVVDNINERELFRAYKEEALLAIKGAREGVIAALEHAATIFDTDPSDENIEKAEKDIDNAKTTLKKAQNDVDGAAENYRNYLKQSYEQLTLEEYARRAKINLETRKTWNEKAFVATASLYRSIEIEPKEMQRNPKEGKRPAPGKERVKLPQEMILDIMERVNPALKRARTVQPPPL